jgi:hypothetical protein
MYLYDYLYKGIRKILADARKQQGEQGLENPEEGMLLLLYIHNTTIQNMNTLILSNIHLFCINTVDEITRFVLGRVLTGMSCTNRVFNYEDYPKQEPTCLCITLKMPETMMYHLEHSGMNDMAAYFFRPEALLDMKLLDFFTEFHYTLKKPTSATVVWYEIQVPYIQKPVYIVAWIVDKVRFVRANMVYPHNGEIFYFRIIMRKRVVLSIEDLYMHDGETYTSLQACAEAAGYLTDQKEAEYVFNEAVGGGFINPRKLRSLFILLTVEGWPTLKILKDNFNVLVEDYREESDEMDKYRHLLRDFKILLRSHNKSLEDFSLHIHMETGEVINLEGKTELEEVRERMKHEKAQLEFDTLNSTYPNNKKQEEFMKYFKVRVT